MKRLLVGALYAAVAATLAGCQSNVPQEAARGDGVVSVTERQAGTAAVYDGLKKLSASDTAEYRNEQAVDVLRQAAPDSSWEPAEDFLRSGRLEVWTEDFVVCLTLGPQRDFTTDMGRRCL